MLITSPQSYFNRHVAADVENYFRLRVRMDVSMSKEPLGQWGRDSLRGLTLRDYTEEDALRCLRGTS